MLIELHICSRLRRLTCDAACSQLAEKRFKEVNEAYSILSDPNERAQYDASQGFGMSGRSRDPSYYDDFGSDMRYTYDKEGFGFSESTFTSKDFDEAMRRAGYDPSGENAGPGGPDFEQRADFRSRYDFDFEQWNRMEYGPRMDRMKEEYEAAWEEVRSGGQRMGSPGYKAKSTAFADASRVFRSSELYHSARKMEQVRAKGSKNWLPKFLVQVALIAGTSFGVMTYMKKHA